MSDLVPLDRLAIPPALIGEYGRNRAHGARQVDANDDRSAVLALLARYADSPVTLSSYRKEAERLLLWCVHLRKRALLDLMHEDMLLFERFLGDPQPAKSWNLASGMKVNRTSPG